MKLQPMSRTFRAHHPYHPYDPYIHEQVTLTQTPSCLQIATCDKSSKDGKDRKGHVVQNSWYNKSRILDHLLSSSSLQEQEGL
jgi:hypothetical protein